MFNIFRRELEWGGRPLVLESGRIARQADAAVLVSYGETTVLCTAVAARSARPGQDFFPLTVNYQEKTFAAGKIPGGFFKREGRPTEREILTCRVIDRGLRPLFPDGYHNETQVIAWVLSADDANDPDVLGISGASLSLMLAREIPFDRPIAGIRVGRIDGSFVLFPTHEERAASDLDLVVAGTEEAVVMVECGAGEVSEEVILDALELAHTEIRRLIAVQRQIVAEAGVTKPEWVPAEPPWPAELPKQLERWREPLRTALHTRGKFEQRAAVAAVRDQAIAELDEAVAEQQTPWVKRLFTDLVKQITRETILDKQERLDGRRFDEIRPVSCETGMLPRTHGSALFTRGETQAMVVCTLGTSDESQLIEAFEGEYRQRFMLHYNFPPFSVREAKFLRGPGRREIGHGQLARRALAAVVPAEDAFLYSIRVVSDILESNGSSSMATVCGGSMALMDAGVPISSAVAGVAMGLVSDGDRYGVLTDIAGQEDHYGDMDFKVAGTTTGITALQMDIKVSGLSREIMGKALMQAREGRLFLLKTMGTAIQEPRTELSPYAPRIYQMKIPVDLIRNVIGPGGKMIRSIVDASGARINVEDDGTVQIATNDRKAAEKAMAMIDSLTHEPKIGEVFDGEVKRIEPYGAFVEILPGQDGLLHISEVAFERIPDIRDRLSEGDKIKVKIIDIDGYDRISSSSTER